MPPPKTTRPAVQGAVQRQRLYRLLDRRGVKPVTWVCGPPGAGKTTLVASFLASTTLRSVWYQVDASDTDVATFFYYLGRAAPRGQTPLPLLTPDDRLGLEAFSHRYFREFYARLRIPFVLVLDNYHEVAADAPLHDALRHAIAELPAGGRLVIISRTSPPASLARLRVHQAFDTIEWSDLRLTFGEARRVAARFARVQVPLPELHRLYDLTDGWMAGLVLLLTRRDTLTPRAPLDAPELLFDYFAGEIFSRTDPRTQDVLLKTSFLSTIRPHSAVDLTGESSAGDLIADLHRNGYFTNRVLAPDPVYQYHPLYRAFLQARAARALPTDVLATTRIAAARIAERDGEIESAAALLRSGGHWEALAELIGRHAPSLLEQGRVETVQAWLGAIPEPVLRGNPWLLYWRGVCQLGRDHDACRRDSEAALAAFRRTADLDGALLSWSTVVTSLLMQGVLQPLDHWIPLLDELQREMPGMPAGAVEARVAAAMLLAILYRRPSHPEGCKWADRALAATRRGPDTLLRALAAFGWIFYQWIAVEGSNAGPVAEEMRALKGNDNVSPIVAMYVAVPLIWYEFLSGLPSYRLTLAEVLELARRNGLEDHTLIGSVLTCGALAALSDGQPEISRACIEALSHRLERFGGTYAVAFHAISIRQALVDGAPDRALASVRQLEGLGYTTGFPLEEVAAHGTVAHWYCERREYHTAARHVRQMLDAARRMGTCSADWMAHTIDAYVSFESGRTQDGDVALRVAMELGRRGGYMNSQVWIPRVMANLCARALDAGIEVDYVRSLIARRRLMPDPPCIEVDTWPWPVRIHTSGGMAVLVGDRPIVWGGKIPRKPLALLQRLIDHGPPGARDEVLMDDLWPDADGDAARRALATAVFRLRRLLTRDEAVVRADGRTRLDPACCWVDVWAIERLLEKAERASGSSVGTSGDIDRWVQRALALWGTDGPEERPSGGARARLRERLMRQVRRIERATRDW